jgi:hypothetical protein
MKRFGILFFALALATAVAQIPAPVFSTTTVNFNLSQLSLPGARQSVAGAETDVLLTVTPNNQFGETTLVNPSFTFVGGRYNRTFPAVSNWLNNLSPNLDGMQFQFGVTASLGAVQASNVSHWGERAGAFINYAVSNSWTLGFEAQWCNLPGYQHNTYSIALGPAFHF